MPYKQFVTWPRAVVDANAAASNSTGAATAGVEDECEGAACGKGKGKASSLAAKSRAARANRLKDWQEDKKWSLKVGATLQS